MVEQNAELAQLFAGARLAIQLPPSAAASQSPVVFFDELLKVDVQLSLPSHPLLPTSPQLPSDALLPLSLSDQLSVPPLLKTFLACTHISLSTDYVPPSDSGSTGGRSANPHEPFSSVHKNHIDFQLLPAQSSDQQSLSSVRCFSASWCGNQRSNGPLSTLHTPNITASEREQANHMATLRQEHNAWNICWSCPVPVNFIATPYEPLLAVTAALTLRLDPAHLRKPDADSPLRSDFSHSLLTPLHEGPIYPDESRSQSVARATAASALGLDGPQGLGVYLADLPKDVLGSTSGLVTPKTGLSALQAILRRPEDTRTAQVVATRLSDSGSKALHQSKDSNGDLAAVSRPSVSLEPGPSDSASSDSSGLRVYKRSTREIVALKTGLNVRMRTLYTNHDPFQSASSTNLSIGRQDLTSSTQSSTSLVLCVELENQFDSGIVFNVSDIKVRIHPPSALSSQPFQLHARLLSYKTEDRFPVMLSQGQQHNLLYYLSSSADSTTPISVPAVTGNTTRNVTILVSGSPTSIDSVARQPTQVFDSALSHTDANKTVNEFESQWNCSLDVRPLLFNSSSLQPRDSTRTRIATATAI